VVDDFFAVEVPDEFPICINSVNVDFNRIILEYFTLECFFFCDCGYILYHFLVI
jgi:hypothetical protein